MQHLQRMKPRTAAGLEGRRKSLSPGCCLHSQSSQPLEEPWGLAWEKWESKLEERAFLWCVLLYSRMQVKHRWSILWVGSSGACATGRTEFAVIFLGAQYILTFSQGHGKKKTPTFLKWGEDWTLTHASPCDPYSCPFYRFRWLLALLIYLTCNDVTVSCLLPHPVPLIII